LQVDVQHRPMRAHTSFLQRVYFCMGAPETLVISPSDNRPIFDKHTADERIGTDKSQSTARQVQGLLHVLHVDGCVVRHKSRLPYISLNPLPRGEGQEQGRLAAARQPAPQPGGQWAPGTVNNSHSPDWYDGKRL